MDLTLRSNTLTRYLIPLSLFYLALASVIFVMRVSIPALFVLVVFLGRALHSQSPGVLKRIILMVLVIFGSVTVLVEFRRHIIGIRDAGTILQTPSVSQVTSVNEWGLSTEKDATIILQYVGSSQAPFFELMAKEP